jgi:hypothetical protein
MKFFIKITTTNLNCYYLSGSQLNHLGNRQGCSENNNKNL